MSETTDLCACSMNRRSSRALTSIYDRALEPSGLLSTQYSLLRKLEDEGKTISDLASQLHLDRTTLTRNLRVLEKSRLIRFDVGEDRRERHVVMTTKGRRSLDEAVPLWKSAQQTVKKHLGPARYAQFLELLASISAIEA